MEIVTFFLQRIFNDFDFSKVLVCTRLHSVISNFLTNYQKAYSIIFSYVFTVFSHSNAIQFLQSFRLTFKTFTTCYQVQEFETRPYSAMPFVQRIRSLRWNFNIFNGLHIRTRLKLENQLEERKSYFFTCHTHRATQNAIKPQAVSFPMSITTDKKKNNKQNINSKFTKIILFSNRGSRRKRRTKKQQNWL